MEKLKDLMLASARGAGIPDKIDVASGGLMLKFLLSGRILIPAVVMLTNMNHHHAFGTPLIHLKGGLVPDPELPFGCRIDGDIDMDKTEYALGYILISITATFSELKPYILSGQIDEISLLWKERVAQLSRGKKELLVDDNAHLPPPKQLKDMS